jgi:hypothetical protein
MSRTVMTAPEEGKSYVPTYYPGTTDGAAATPIQLGPGDEVRAIDFRLLRTATVTVRGHIFNSITGRPGRDTHVHLSKRGRSWPWDSSRVNSTLNRDGSFEIRGVTPGSYHVVAMWFHEDEQFVARAPLEIGTSDVDGVELVIRRGVDIEGRVHVEGMPENVLPPAETAPNLPSENEEQLEMTKLHVSLRLRDTDRWLGGSARVKEDGGFVAKNLTDGDYRISLHGTPSDFYLKAARLGASDILEEGFSLGGGPPSGRFELTLNPHGARVEGTVSNDEGQPVSGASVVLVPEMRRRDQGRFYKTTSTDQYGNFQLRGITPGEYVIFAWEEIEGGAYRDPDFLRPFEKRGQSLRVQEGQAANVTLEVIAARDSLR